MDSYLTKKQVIVITARSATSLWRDVREGRFPAPRQLGPLRIGWLRSEIENWLNGRPLASTKSN